MCACVCRLFISMRIFMWNRGYDDENKNAFFGLGMYWGLRINTKIAESFFTTCWELKISQARSSSYQLDSQAQQCTFVASCTRSKAISELQFSCSSRTRDFKKLFLGEKTFAFDLTSFASSLEYFSSRRVALRKSISSHDNLRGTWRNREKLKCNIY